MLLQIQKAVRKKVPKDSWDDMEMIEGVTGDILYAHEYIESVMSLKSTLLDSIKNVIPLPSDLGTVYAWDLLKYYVDSESIETLMKESTYKCPFNEGNTHFWNLPIGILYSSQKNFKWYKSTLMIADKQQSDFLFSDYTLSNLTLGRLSWCVTGITQAFLGHGYTSDTRPCDGDGKIVLSYMSLSNGDKLICASWEWYNK